jgi:hypothetical protein
MDSFIGNTPIICCSVLGWSDDCSRNRRVTARDGLVSYAGYPIEDHRATEYD